MTQTMKADVATADEYDIVVDSEGTIWIRMSTGNGRYVWTYVTDEGFSLDDQRGNLPTNYEPYLPLDIESTALIKRALHI